MMKQTSHSSLQETELINIETAHHHEEDKMRVLYEASYKGCVSTLNSLLQEGPGILQKISSQTVFIETPLHISASHGHLEFTKALLSYKPELALERNSSQSTPLHFASAEGHTDIVKQLVKYGEEASLIRDQEGRIPLHYAVIRGRRDVVWDIIRAKPESFKILDDKGKTILHLCVTYNQVEILKELVKLYINDALELLIEKDLDGKNTVLHLAIMLKQVEVLTFFHNYLQVEIRLGWNQDLLSYRIVSYLISIPKRRSEALKLTNDMGYTAPDIVHRIPKDSKSLEIQVILMEFGIKCGRRERIDVASEEDRSGKKKRWWKNVFKSIDQWFNYNGDWVEDMRGNLSLVATVISTITFQAALNPPGSVIQQNIIPIDSTFNLNDVNGPFDCFTGRNGYGHMDTYCPGEALLAHLEPGEFKEFIFYNSISFVASLCVALLLVSGVPIKHRFVVWLLSIAMGIALTCLLNAYFLGLGLISLPVVATGNWVFIFTLIFIGLYALVGIYIALKFVIWVVKRLREKLTKVKELKEKVNSQSASDVR